MLTRRIPEHWPTQGTKSSVKSARRRSGRVSNVVFHGCSWPDAAKLVSEMNHDGLRTFGARVIYCEARSQLQPEVRLTLERELTDRLVVETRYGFTIEKAMPASVKWPAPPRTPLAFGCPNACGLEHKELMFRAPDHRYDRAVPGTFRLVPTADMRQKLAADYMRMSDDFLHGS